MEFFGFEMQTDQQCETPICRTWRKKVPAPRSNTSNLRFHLRQNHPDFYTKLHVKLYSSAAASCLLLTLASKHHFAIAKAALVFSLKKKKHRRRAGQRYCFHTRASNCKSERQKRGNEPLCSVGRAFFSPRCNVWGWDTGWHTFPIHFNEGGAFFRLTWRRGRFAVRTPKIHTIKEEKKIEHSLWIKVWKLQIRYTRLIPRRIFCSMPDRLWFKVVYK